MRSRLPFVSLVVPVYNGELTISDVLQHISELNYPDDKLEVIVVDDGSVDETVQIVKKYPVKLIAKEHSGYPSTMNAGVRVAKREIVVIIDADIYLKEDWLEIIVREFNDPKVGIVSGYLATKSNASFWAKVVGFESEDRYDRLESKYVDYITSASTAYRRKMLEEIGFFNEKLRRNSDEDLAHRAFEAGWKVVLQKDAVCYHEWVPSLRRYFKNQVATVVYEINNFLQHPELLRGKEQHPPSLYVPLMLASLIVLTPLWFLLNVVWVSLLAFLCLILYHAPQAIRIIQKHKDWSMLLFPIAFNVRYFAWLIGLAIGFFNFLKSR